ncbi:hypothetical protein AB5N19_07620 [Seiridium cardinale]|uniref:Uncharacterized protein n=1 Tax=Seiridium cardinale TaxID=138064 RepID=A0ABR2XT91_9PEZI
MTTYASGYTACPNKPTDLPAPFSSIPDSFRCKEGTGCKWLGENITVLCCPTGNDCEVIAPVVCNLGLMDPSANPEALIKTMLQVGELPECAGACCPWGYECDGNQTCVITADTSAEQSALKLAALETGTGTATTRANTQSATIVSSIATTAPLTNQPPSTTSSGVPANQVSEREGSNSTAVVAAAVLGSLLGTLLVVGSFFVLRRKRSTQAKRISQRTLMKAELDVGGELRPPSIAHMLSAERDPVELPATPLERFQATLSYLGSGRQDFIRRSKL